MRDIQVGYIFGVLGQNNTGIRIENSFSVSALIVYFIRIQQRNYIIDIRNLKKGIIYLYSGDKHPHQLYSESSTNTYFGTFYIDTTFVIIFDNAFG